MSYLECGMLQIHKIDHVKCGTLNWQDLKKIEKKKTQPNQTWCPHSYPTFKQCRPTIRCKGHICNFYLLIF